MSNKIVSFAGNSKLEIPERIKEPKEKLSDASGKATCSKEAMERLEKQLKMRGKDNE